MSGFIRLSKVLEEADGMLFFECPGCEMLHGVNVSRQTGPKWQWDGNAHTPTFSPSVLVTYKWGLEQSERVCHSFVRGGCIEFLGDCTHKLAGQTVPMVELEDAE